MERPADDCIRLQKIRARGIGQSSASAPGGKPMKLFKKLRNRLNGSTPGQKTAAGLPPMAGNKPPLFLGKNKKSGGPVVFSGEGALLTVGPPGTGKSRGVAIWNLLEYPGSMLVTDPKGQLTKWSAAHRQRVL